MSYTKTTWQNLPNQTTPVNATNMNKIENELEYLDNNCNVLTVPTNKIANNTDVNNIISAGVYLSENATVTSTLTHIPSAVTTAFKLIVEYLQSSERIKQTIIMNSAQAEIFTRNYTASGWGNWYKISMTQAT